MTQIAGYELGLPEGWRGWRPGQAAEVADEVAAALADGEAAQARVRQAVAEFDRAPVEGMLLQLGVWVPDRSTGETVASLHVELLVGGATRDEFLRSVEKPPRQRAAKVFQYNASPAETNAGPAVVVAHAIAPRRGGQVVLTYEWNIFPTGASESMLLSFSTPLSAVADAMGEQSAKIANMLSVTLADG